MCMKTVIDVSGFLLADPRIIDNPPGIDTITYRELRELAYMGAAVLHEDAIFPVRRKAFRSISAIQTARKRGGHGLWKALARSPIM